MKLPVILRLAMPNFDITKKRSWKELVSYRVNREIWLDLHHCVVASAHLDSKSKREPTYTPLINIAAVAIRPITAIRMFRRTRAF